MPDDVRAQAGDAVGASFQFAPRLLYLLLYITQRTRGKEYLAAHPHPHANQCSRHGSGWCCHDDVGEGGRFVISTKN